jgi:ferric-dicitrate binding protein FerR (iron transport regulator)
MTSHDSEAEREAAETAAMWLQALKSADDRERKRFLEWLSASPMHVRLFLEMAATAEDLESIRRRGLIDPERLLREFARIGAPAKETCG